MADHISLLELLRRVGECIYASPALNSQWVVAEVSDCRPGAGHIYFTLLQKDSAGQPVATMRATIWQGTRVRLQRKHGAALNGLLVNGAEVRVLASVNFHEKYGLSLNVTDIDPTYQRDSSKIQAEILAALRREGILEANKQRELVWPVQRVAVISSPTAAGYGDFMNQLAHNRYGIKIYTKLFEASMQGLTVSATVRDALERIEQVPDLFDCVVIIRGGGATTDLAGFDDLELARAVARYFLPVVVGIGHERDNTVLDFIAHTRVKTPTAAAEWLIGQGEQALAKACDLATRIAADVRARLSGDRRQLESMEQMIPLLARTGTEKARRRLENISALIPLLVQKRVQDASQRLERASRIIESSGQRSLSAARQRLDNQVPMIRQILSMRLRGERDRLSSLSDKVTLLSPQSVLKRGYSITLDAEGHALRDPHAVKSGQMLKTRLAAGEIESVVK